MSTPDDRPRPQYGEYATPEEQRARIRQPDATDALESGQTLPTTPPAAPPVPPTATPDEAVDGPAETARARRRTIDRIITIGLLIYGAFTVGSTIPQMIDYATFAQAWITMAGVDATFDDYASGRLWGTVAAITLGAGWVVSAALSWLMLSRGKLAFWVPLAGAVVSITLATIFLTVPLLSDPAIISGITELSS